VNCSCPRHLVSRCLRQRDNRRLEARGKSGEQAAPWPLVRMLDIPAARGFGVSIMPDGMKLEIRPVLTICLPQPAKGQKAVEYGHNQVAVYVG
jgi:hypothetical protein